MLNLKKFIAFCLVGGTGAAIELIMFNVVYILFSFHVSKFIALLIALTFNFIINRKYTFSASSGKKRKQIPRYVFVYSLGIVINYSSSLLINKILGGSILFANISVAAGIVIAIPITFIGSAYWVFKD
jgi:dolichol-phosphate mannosyltransferase